MTYLEAMRRPKKHIVNTLAIGMTAILIVPRTESPAAPTARLSMISARIRPIILTDKKIIKDSKFSKRASLTFGGVKEQKDKTEKLME